MFKKYLFFALSFLLLFNYFKADAFLNKVVYPTYNVNATYTNLLVVSENDFNDSIDIQASGSPGSNLYIQGNFDRAGYQAISPTNTINTGTGGIASTIANYTWSSSSLKIEQPYFYIVKFKATNTNTNVFTDSGQYTAEVNYATINLTNNKGLTNGGKITTGTSINFNCTGTSEMYFGPSANWPSGASKVQSKYNGASLADYTLNYSTTLNTIGTYKVECDNVGGANTRQSITFEVENASCPTGQTREGSPSGTCHAPCSSGQTWNDTTKQCVTSSCPTGQTRDDSPSGTCHVPCSSGQTWNDTTKQCVTSSCPTGQTRDDSPSGTCHVPCSSGQTWNDTTKQCVTSSCPTGQEMIAGVCKDTFDITNISSNPNKTNTANTFSWTSSADTCNIFTNDKATRLNPAASSKSGNNFSATVPANNMPLNPGNYAYYIKCYSASKFTSSNLEKDNIDPDHTGWKSYTVNISNTNNTEFTISNITSSPNYTNTANTFTWNSDADNSCGLYEYGDGYLYYTGGPVKIVDATRSGNTWTATLPTNKVPTSATSVKYYIGCFDAIRLASEQNGVTRDWYDQHKGWKDYTAAYTVNEANTFDITNISSNPNKTNTANTFSWTSSADTCNIFTNDKATRLNPAASSKSGNNFSATVPANNMPLNPGNYAYYIKCYSASKFTSSNLEKDNIDPDHTGWKSYTVNITTGDCPTGQTREGSPSGTCHVPCSFEQTWNDTTKQCVNSSCPTGQTREDSPSGTCHVPCTTGYSWNDTSGQCVASSCPTGQELRNGVCVIVNYFDSSNLNVSPKEINKDNTFTWNSEANKCDVYSYEFDSWGNYIGRKLNSSSKIIDEYKFSAIVPASNMPSSAGNYGYYIRCESTNGAYESIPSSRVIWDNGYNIGWRYFTVNINQSVPACSNGQIRSTPTGVCHTSCPSGYTWNETFGTCGNPNPNCSWADPSVKTSVSCEVPYVCENGNPPELRVYYKDGHYDLVNPPTLPFTWDSSQYQYQFYCDSTHLTPVAPLRKTYTHFVTFNISASNVQKGSKINLNWSVEDPNITCNIKGKTIKTGEEVFNTSNAQKVEYALNSKISTSTGSVQVTARDLAIGDYKTIMGGYLTINNSIRFIASCTDTGTYKPEYYQLVRDIYVTGEEER